MSGGQGRAFEGDVGRPEHPFSATMTVATSGKEFASLVDAELRTRGEVTESGDDWLNFVAYRAEEAEAVVDGLIDLLDANGLTGSIAWTDDGGQHTRST